MQHLSQDQIRALTDRELRAIRDSTRPDGIFAQEVEWACEEIEARVGWTQSSGKEGWYE